MKELLLIYQDCPLCGARKGWGEEQTKLADTHGFTIRKVSFVAKEAKGLPSKALEAGIDSLPFFTDGKKFAKSVEEFVGKKKPAKRKVKEIADGNVEES